MEPKVKVGIDISKATFDVALPVLEKKEYLHKKFTNNESGFKKFYDCLPKESHCIMEASGVYFLQLATFLFNKGIDVSVVNPLTIKHFARMRLMRSKTDRKDSMIIAQYGKTENPPLWKVKSSYLLELQQIQALLDNFTKDRTRLINQREAFTNSGIKNKIVSKSLTREINNKEKQIEVLENEMEKITREHHPELFERLKSVPGIGKRTAMMLIVVTDGFTKFENSKQLSAYIGLSPRIFESGTSVKGKSRICKMGMGRMRALLYLCAMRAKHCNQACRIMFDRLKAKGKNGKLILIALANKLIRQVFALGTSQNYYMEISSI